MECPCCGAMEMDEKPVLWPQLITDWGLAEYEVSYINRQQGFFCVVCKSNLRTMVLAKSIMACYGFAGCLKEFVQTDLAKTLRILEINEAFTLTQFLKEIPGHLIVEYPNVDMMSLPFEANHFDLILHSETLEHVEHPIRGLSECLRVLKPGGFCAFTIPIIIDRLTRSRAGLPPSYHGSPENPPDNLVHTEYGADAWKHVIQAGFEECRIFSMDFPAAHALVGKKKIYDALRG
jgi:SAM-dependent methyltransferase